MSTNVLQWNRKCTVVVGPSTGAVRIEELRVQFEVVKTPGKTPNGAKILIYNLSQETEARIKGEFAEVLLNVGYANATELVFRGNLRHVFAYRQDADRIVQLDAADGDKAYREAKLNVTLAAGTTIGSIIDHAIAAMGGVTKGHVTIKDRKLGRGKVVSGMVRDIFDPIAESSEADWSIQDNTLQIVPCDSTLPTEAIVISADTGMLNAPELTDKGIKVECLLNPAIRVGGKIRLDNNDLKAKIGLKRASLVPKKKVTGKTKAKPKKGRELARLDPDGVYKVLQVTHKGDTRGMEWRSIVEAVALQKSIPSGRQAA